MFYTFVVLVENLFDSKDQKESIKQKKKDVSGLIFMT